MSQFVFRRTGDADYPRFLNILLQGPAKSGKSTFITTAPNVVIASCESGLMSIAHLNVPYVDIDGTDKLRQLETILRDDTLRLGAAKHLGLPQIETVAIDTLDAWQEMLKKEILAENRATKMQQADWGTLKERMAAVLKAYLSLPMNVIFTVHTSSSQDEEGRLVYSPALQGSIRDDIAGMVDFSLLAFRQRETAANGTSRTAYYLKNEGDLKNPHLGNRAAGRLPEICAPDFTVLHKAVFSGMKPSEDPVAVLLAARYEDEQAAQSLPDQTEPTVFTMPPVPPPPTGIPADDPEGPITASGVTMLTKSYLEHGLILPENLKEWTLGKGRKIAKWFMAWKTDKAAGQKVNRLDLIDYLTAMDAFNGEMDGVQVGAAKAATKTKKPDKPDEAAKAEDAAVALVEEQMDAVTVLQRANADATCDDCGKPIDDADIANLGLSKYKRVLCTVDYRNAVKLATQ